MLALSAPMLVVPLLAGHLSLADVALAPFVRQFAHVDREWFGQLVLRHAELAKVLNALPREDRSAVKLVKRLKGRISVVLVAQSFGCWWDGGHAQFERYVGVAGEVLDNDADMPACRDPAE